MNPETGNRAINSSTDLSSFAYIELYVGNAVQAMHFYRTGFGFTPVAYAGMETGTRDRCSYVVQQGKIRLVLTAPLGRGGPISEHLQLHGDSIKDIAFRTADATQAFNLAVEAGATPVSEPTTYDNGNSLLVKATVATYGDTWHSFVQADDPNSFLPGYQALNNMKTAPTGLCEIDHIAVCLQYGTLDQWVDFYVNALKFYRFHEEVTATEYSAMHSKVVQSNNDEIKIVMLESAPSKRKSQVEEFLSFNQGAGTQHLAVTSSDIISSVQSLQDRYIEFVSPPTGSYYGMLKGRIGKLSEEVAALRELGILADNDEWGYLLQIFTKPLGSTPTLFIELIQRKYARGFGSGNIKALFEAIEREQALRGNL